MAFNGCIESSGFSTAELRYLISVNNVPVVRHEFDMCTLITFPQVTGLIKVLGLPNKCPVGKVKKLNLKLLLEP
jgi:hypothetical protein